MNEGLIPRRYAKALLAFAREKKADERVYGLMQRIAASFDAEPALQQAMANPFVSAADKVALIRTAAGIKPGQSDEVLDDFLHLLIERDRVGFIRMIALAYIDLYRRANDIYAVTVTSASDMAPAELDRIRNIVQRHLGGSARLEMTALTDPSLIGGFAISVGNERLDASVANELKQLRQILGANS